MHTLVVWSRKGAAVLSAVALSIAGLIIASPAQAAPGGWATTAAVSGASAADGLTVHVEGSGYTGLPDSSTGPAAGVYVALRDTSVSDADLNADQSKAAAVQYVRGIAGGAFAVDLTAPVASLAEGGDYEVIVWVAHGLVTEDTLLDTVPVSLSADQRAALFPGDEDGGQDETGGQWATTAAVSGASAADGLTVHVEGSGYTGLPDSSTGPAAGVYVALRDTSVSDADLNADQSKAAAVQYVRGIAGGAFAVDLTAPVASLAEGGDYEVIVWVAHGLVTEDTLLDTVPVSLSADQRAALFPGDEDGGQDETGDQDEPGDQDETDNGADPGPTPKIALSSARVTAGDTLVIKGSGFVAGEKVAGTVHSRLVRLGSKTVNSAGKVRFSWKVPSNFASGKHRVVLTSSTSKASLRFRVAAAAPAAPSAAGTAPVVTCTMETVAGATGTPQLLWGVKSSFVSYIDGGIAKGSVSASNGASRTGGGFLWGSGSGTLNASGEGTVSFPGSVAFSGHDGALQTRFSNLRVRSTGSNGGTLIADVASRSMEGNNTGGSSIAIANLRFSGLSDNGGQASARLTGAGARAFANFYEPGEALDSLTLSFSGAKAASKQQVCYDANGNRVNPDGTPYVATAGLHGNLGGYALAGQDTSLRGLDLLSAGLLLLLLPLIRRMATSKP